MVDRDQTLAIIAAGVLASGRIPFDPIVRGNNFRTDAQPTDWLALADQLKAGGGKEHPAVAMAVALAKRIHAELYPAL